ncbi:MAG: tetratricopeptide repeat protein [Proteobacteria bacterium]|nr:tetratricopeptide repeat protein [Pseudomonadota bacterium]
MPASRFDLGQTLQDGLRLHREGRLHEAEKLYARALKAVPDNFDALNLLGAIKAQTGKMGEALRLLTAAVKLNPGAADALVNLANVLHALKRDAEALDCLDKALRINPHDTQTQLNRASALLSMKRPQDALASLDAVIAREPSNAAALLNRGVAKAELGRQADALGDFNAALLLAPGNPTLLYNRGSAFLQLGKPTEALADLERTVATLPEHKLAWNNRGRALEMLNRHDDAAASFGKAIGLDKDYADAHFNLALTLLALGKLEQGLAEYEWRWKRTGVTDRRRGYGRPLWVGEFPLGRKAILLHAEQGLGDTIQFARYASMLAGSGGRVILEVQPELKTLLTNLPAIASCHARGEALPAYDVQCPLGSLPLALKTTAANVPAPIPYVAADPERVTKWRPAIDVLPGKRVALAWAGHVHHINDTNRSIPLATLEPLLAQEGVSFVSIQHELRDSDADLLARHRNVTHLGEQFADMADTAAVLSLVDLVIAVDTSVAHLAAAMGRPTWVLLPFTPDWRWTLTGAHSPWYPQARLFRQPAIGDWPAVVAALRDALNGDVDA